MKMFKVWIEETVGESFLVFNLATEDQKESSFVAELSEKEVKEFTEIQIAFDKMQDRLKELYYKE